MESGKSDEQSLFDQFSDILDKIATSLGHSKKGNNSQSIEELSDSLSVAAAQQVQVQRAPVEHKTPDARCRTAPATEQKEEQPVADVSVEAEVVVAQKAPVAEASAPAAPAQAPTQNTTTAPTSAKTEAAPEATQQQTAPQADVKADVKADVQAQVAVAVADAPVVEVDVEVIAEAVIAEDAAPATPVKAAPVTQAAPEAAPVVEAEIQTQVHVDKNVKAEQSDENAQAPTSATVTADASVRIAETDQADFVDPQPQVNKVAQDKAVDMRQMLLQSAQALINQALLMSPAKQMIEASVAQRLALSVGSSGSGITAQSNTNGQGVASPLLQNKFTQNNSEKSSARELTRTASLRTMERVESALKEIARSKDGKTISLRLDPPSLGSVKIDVTLKDGQLHARFVAESPQVNALLREQSHELQHILRRAGVQADNVIVSVAGESSVDLSHSFQSFDRQGAQQFGESSKVSGNVGSGFDGSVETAVSSTTTVQPLDHWVA